MCVCVHALLLIVIQSDKVVEAIYKIVRTLSVRRPCSMAAILHYTLSANEVAGVVCSYSAPPSTLTPPPLTCMRAAIM